MVRSMTVREYDKWVRNPKSRCASLPRFFMGGVERTRNVIKGDATISSIQKREAFLKRHLASYKRNPTERRRIAIKNWGFALGPKRGEKKNCLLSRPRE